jgi:flavin reductase (DIM6/NTAB) family NADH-FMN oxidoreductase RutF
VPSGPNSRGPATKLNSHQRNPLSRNFFVPGQGLGNHGYRSPVLAKLVSRLEYPMYVVTAAARGERSGCLVGFGTQTSIRPERFLACISRKNHTFPVASEAGVLAVHFLSDEPRERELAERFGSETGDEVDKFDGIEWHEGPGGVPLLDGIPNRLVGQVLERIDLGDHMGFLLEPLDVQLSPGFEELGFQEAKGIEPGHPA